MKTGIIDEVAFEKGPLLPGVLVGDGITLYPGTKGVPDPPRVAETLSDTPLGKPNSDVALGKPNPPEVGTAVSVLDTSGLLEAVEKPTEGCARD